MASLGTEHAVRTSKRALLEVENFGNSICICGQYVSHLSMTSQHGTKARRAKSVPSGTKPPRNREWAIAAVLGTGAVLVGVLCPEPLVKIQEGCEKKMV